MKHNKLLYIILALVLLFLIIFNKNLLNLEGLASYAYLPNINKINKKQKITGSFTFNDCVNRCNPPCKGFITNIPTNSRSTLKGECTLYNDDDLSMNDLKNLKYEKDSFLYIRSPN